MEGGYIRPSGLMFGSRQMGTEGILTLSARLGAELRAVELEVWGEGGSLAQPIRKRAGAPGMVTVVKGSYEKKDPLFGLRNVNYKPFSAFWLGLNLPVAITRPVPVKLKIAEKHIRMVPGTKREIKVKVERQVRGPIELKWPSSAHMRLSRAAKEATVCFPVHPVVGPDCTGTAGKSLPVFAPPFV